MEWGGEHSRHTKLKLKFQPLVYWFITPKTTLQFPAPPGAWRDFPRELGWGGGSCCSGCIFDKKGRLSCQQWPHSSSAQPGTHRILFWSTPMGPMIP